MNKKLISLLLAICLVVGLLPVASIAADQEEAKIAIGKASGDNEIEVTEGGDPVYRKNLPFAVFGSSGEDGGTGYEYDINNVGNANADDWNLKFEYPLGGQPTLTLKNFKLILADQSGSALSKDNGDGTKTGMGSSTVGIAARDNSDLKIVLEGENEIRAANGVIQADTNSTTSKLNSLTIEGVNGGSLTGSGKSIGIRSRYGVPVTIKNTTLSIVSNSTNSTAAPIYVANAAIAIENSTLNLSNLKTSGSVNAIHAEGTGTITVKNSNLELSAPGAAFNKAPTVSPDLTDPDWKAFAGDDKDHAAVVTSAEALVAKYVKMTFTNTRLPKAVSVKVAGTELTISRYDKAVYTQNTTFQKKDTAGNLFDVVEQTITTDDSNWNTRFVWHIDDEFPTLYVDGMIVDDYNEETSKWKGHVNNAADAAYTVGIEILAGQKVKVVLVGEDSQFKCRYGIKFLSDLEIKSEGATMLTMRNMHTGISSHDTAGTLTIDANLDMEVTSYSTGTVNNAVIQAKGNITIDGGNITAITHSANGYMYGIYARNAGDVIINGGNITANDVTGSSATNAAITSNTGKVIITGGTVTPTSKSNVGIYGKTGIEITGGIVNINVPMHGMNVGSDGQIAINGGLVEITANSGAFAKEPVLGEGISGIVGPSAADVWAFRATTDDYRCKYVKTGAGVADGAPTKPMPETPENPGGGSDIPVDPGTYGEELANKPVFRMGYNNYTLTHYDKPIYLVNASSTVEDTDAAEFTRWLPSRTGANESNYTMKIVWNTGEANPKVILRGFKWDQYNNETGKIESTFNTTANEYTGTGVTMYPLLLPLDVSVDIIITGEDSLIEGQFGIVYQGPLSIKSEGNAKLVMNAMTGCIIANGASAEGDTLTIDANLDLTSNAYYNSTFGTAVIHTYKANMVINGGNISCKVTDSTMTTGLNARDAGNIIIKGGKIVAQGNLGASQTTGAVNVPNGKLVVSGGELEPVPSSNMGVYARWGIDVTGGAVRGYSPMNGMRAGTTDDPQPINITGGLVEFISASGAFFDKPVLGEGITGYAGENYKDVKTYDPEKDYKKKYVKIGVNVTEPNASNVPTLPGSDPNAPGSNPGAPEIEPTANPNAKPGMKLPKAVAVNVGGVKMRITKYDEPVYVVNTPVEYKDQGTKDGENIIEGKVFEGMTPTLTTDENNWNAKFVWSSDAAIPVLYMDGLIIDDYDEENSKWRAYQNDASQAAHTTAIAVEGGQYMKIVAQGKDSQFKTRFGINFKSKIAIESVGNTKIDLWNLSGTINGATGMPLVVNANMDIKLLQYYTGSISQGMMTNQADITINGGKINISFGYDQYSCAIIARDSGNIYINGGEITATSVVGTGGDNGTIKSSEKIVVTGGTLNLTSAHATCMYARKAIEITGGTLNLQSPWYALACGTKDSPGQISFNGGTTTIIAQNAIINIPVVVIGEGVYAYAGAGPRSAVVYDGTDVKLAQKPWFFATDDESKKIVIEEVEDEELEDVLDPTEAPDATDATDATDPTEEVGGPEATTPEDTLPDDEIIEDEGLEEDEDEDDNYYNVTPNLDIVGGLKEDIPDGLIDMGIDSVDMIREILVDNIWAIDDYSDYFAFFDITLMYLDGEEWVEADEEHFPEDGYITAMLPYPEGTDIDTPFTAVHMFTSDAFGMTPGEVELLMPINTDEGILVELTGLSPVAIAWEGAYAEDSIPDPTGDIDVTMFFVMLMFSALGMATVVILNKKRSV